MSDYYGVQQQQDKKVARRKTVPPWMEQVILNRFFFFALCCSHGFVTLNFRVRLYSCTIKVQHLNFLKVTYALHTNLPITAPATDNNVLKKAG